MFYTYSDIVYDCGEYCDGYWYDAEGYSLLSTTPDPTNANWPSIEYSYPYEDEPEPVYDQALAMTGSGATAWAPPVIYSVNPNQWQAGSTTTFTISGAGFGYSPSLSISGTGITGYTNPCASSPSSSCDSTIVATITIDASTPANSQETITVTAGGQNPSGFLPVDTGPGEQNQATAQATTTALVVSILFNNHNVANNANPPCPDSTNGACVVVGQQILLTASVTLNGQPVQLQSQSWDQPPGTITGGYTIDTTTSPPNSGQAVPIPGTANCQTLQGNCLMFYWVEAGNGSVTRTVNYHFTIAGQPQQTVPATFQVTAPANVTVNAPTNSTTVTSASDVKPGVPAMINGGYSVNPGISFTPQYTGPQGPIGTSAEFAWVQFRAGANLNNQLSTGPQYCRMSAFVPAAGGNPTPALDGSFPYAVTPPSRPNDNPYYALQAQQPSGALVGESQISESFTMYLMFDPALPSGCTPWGVNQISGATIQSTCTSNPVPLGTITWSWGCDAINTLMQQAATGTNWVVACARPAQAGNATFIAGNSFPLWTHSTPVGYGAYSCKGTPFN